MTGLGITNMADLEAIYGEANPRSLLKEIDHLNPDYQAFVNASPFVIMATSGAGGLDCSPKGDPAGFVRIFDERTIAIPDRPGNNRIDNLRNLIEDPRVSLLFLIPGHGETLRVNGVAKITIDPAILSQFPIAGKLPKTVIVVTVQQAYFHCSKSVVRSRLWDPAYHASAAALPSAGTILKNISGGVFDGTAYDQAAPQRIRETLY